MTGGPGSRRPPALFGDQEVALVDLLDRLLGGGVVLVGDLTISLAGVDLVRISLRALVTSIAPVDASRPTERVEAEVDRPRALPGDGSEERR